MINPQKKLSFDDLVEGPYHNQVIKPFIKGVYGKELSPTQAVELFLEHKRKFNIGNEITVFGDLSYVRDTNPVNDMSYEERIVNYNAADSVFNAYEGAFEKGGESAGSAILDYAEGFVKSPSLYIGLLVGGGSGKAAQMAQSRLTQEAIKQYAKSQGKKVAANKFVGGTMRKEVIENFGKEMGKQQAIKAGAFEAGVAGLTDLGMQSVEKETGRRDSYSAGRVLGSTALAGGIAGGITYPLAKWQAGQAAKLQHSMNMATFKKDQAIAARKKDVATNKMRADQVKKITEAIQRPVDNLFKDADGSDKTWEQVSQKGQAMLSKMFGDSSFTHAQVRREINENLAYAVEDILSRASAKPDEFLSGRLAAKMDVDKAVARGQINKIFDIDNPDTLTQEVFTAIGRGDISTDLVTKVMTDYGLTMDDFRIMWWSTISEAGRTLGLWGNVAKRLKMTREQIRKELGEKAFDEFETIGKESIGGIERIAGYGTNTTLKQLEDEASRYGASLTGRSLPSVYRQADNFRRAMMVSQPKTFVRNALSVTGKIPLDAGARLIDNAMAYYAMRGNNAFGADNVPISNVNMNDANSIFKYLINNQAAGVAIKRLLKHIGEESYGALSFLNDYSEISRVAAMREGKTAGVGVFQKASQGVADFVNTLNRMQEMTFRRAVFMGSIERQLGRMGIIGSKKTIKVLDDAGKATGKTQTVTPQYKSLSDFIAKGGLEDVNFWTNKDNDLIGRAIDDAMEFTFQGRAPGTKIGSRIAEQGYVKQMWDHFGKAMVDIISNPKGLTRGFGTSVIPFPRFLYNSIKFQLEYSPIGLLDALASDGIRAARRGKLLGGDSDKLFDYGPRTYDYSEIGKGAMGSAMFLAAYKYRKSKYAGERWDEHKNERGEPINLAPLGPPVAPYLFTADAIQRFYSPNTEFNLEEANRILAEGGDLQELVDAKLIGKGALFYRSGREFLREAVKAGIGTQARVGSFSSLIDGFLVDPNALENLTPDNKVRQFQTFFQIYEKLAPFVGEYLNGFFMPFQVMQDIASTVNPDEDIVRETKLAGPIYGKIKSKIPNFAQKLLGMEIEPARVDPFTGGIVRKKSSIPGQLTGLQVTRAPKTPEFAEAERLGLSYSEMVAFNEDPSLDYAFRQAYGNNLAAYRSVIETDWYKNLSDVRKLRYWKETVIPAVRDSSRDYMKTKFVEKMYPGTNYYDVIHEIEKAFPTTESRRELEAYGGLEDIPAAIGNIKEIRKRMKEMLKEEEEDRNENERRRISNVLEGVKLDN